MSIIDRARNYVQEVCSRPTSKYKGIFEGHLAPMDEIARTLTFKRGADYEIVSLAVWLHDLGAILFGRDKHHITGALIAKTLLREWKYPEDKIRRVVGCIRRHRGSQRREPRNMEEQIIAEADAMSAFHNLHGLLLGAYVEEKLSQEEGRITVLEKLQRKWDQLSDESKELVRARYEAILLALS